ncbi:ATPase [Anopheles sinensis]|uniref:ATPase n=1 Tax=Anopheles sinensis TaxID=74873 RepID=A0A084W6P6_ANOSI|nr:ATPase [Anopheles sinensis]
MKDGVLSFRVTATGKGLFGNPFEACGRRPALEADRVATSRWVKACLTLPSRGVYFGKHNHTARRRPLLFREALFRKEDHPDVNSTSKAAGIEPHIWTVALNGNPLKSGCLVQSRLMQQHQD